MLLVLQLNGAPEELHNVRELHVYFNTNIMELHYDNEQDAINKFELTAIGFPNNALTLIIHEQ